MGFHAGRVKRTAKAAATRIHKFGDNDAVTLYIPNPRHPALAAIILVGEPVNDRQIVFKNLNNKTLLACAPIASDIALPRGTHR